VARKLKQGEFRNQFCHTEFGEYVTEYG